MERDPVLLVQACTAAFGDRVLAASRAAAGPEVRFNDGYVFQHLVGGPVSVSELGRRLGVTQQAASQQVADLERRRLVRRRRDPADARTSPVELTPRGWRAIEAGRAERAAIAEELVAVLGPRGAKQLVDALVKVSDHTGALATMADRRLRPEADR